MPVPANDNTLYAELATLKLALSITDTDRDALLLSALTAASRQIDQYTGRRFYADEVVSARTFTLTGRVATDADGQLLLLDDIADTTGLIVETGAAGSATWTAMTSGQYEVTPDNAVSLGLPITGLRSFSGNGWVTGLFRPRARITARWGWPAVPDVVAQACLIQAARLYKRKDSPEGVAGSAEWGVVRVSRVDPDVQALLANVVLPGFA